MHAGDLSLVDLPIDLRIDLRIDLPEAAPANDSDVESERIVAALRESLRRLRAGHRLDARRRMIVA